jgi:hypothetical protein
MMGRYDPEEIAKNAAMGQANEIQTTN